MTNYMTNRTERCIGVGPYLSKCATLLMMYVLVRLSRYSRRLYCEQCVETAMSKKVNCNDDHTKKVALLLYNKLLVFAFLFVCVRVVCLFVCVLHEYIRHYCVNLVSDSLKKTHKYTFAWVSLLLKVYLIGLVQIHSATS